VVVWLFILPVVLGNRGLLMVDLGVVMHVRGRVVDLGLGRDVGVLMVDDWLVMEIMKGMLRFVMLIFRVRFFVVVSDIHHSRMVNFVILVEIMVHHLLNIVVIDLVMVNVMMVIVTVVQLSVDVAMVTMDLVMVFLVVMLVTFVVVMRVLMVLVVVAPVLVELRSVVRVMVIRVHILNLDVVVVNSLVVRILIEVCRWLDFVMFNISVSDLLTFLDDAMLKEVDFGLLVVHSN